jgi:hypothetical protein
MAWFKKGQDGRIETMPGDRPNNDLSDVEFNPSKFREELTSSFTSAMAEMQTQLVAANKPLVDMAQAIQEERAAKAQRQQQQQREQQSQNDSVSAEDFILDPESATRKAMQPVARTTMILAAKIARQETLTEQDFYHGKVKEKTDSLIATLPLEQQSNPASILNCYKIAAYDHQSDITEGKIKSKNAAITFEGGSTGGHSGESTSEGSDTLTSEEKQAASAFGISEKEWAKTRRELSYV